MGGLETALLISGLAAFGLITVGVVVMLSGSEGRPSEAGDGRESLAPDAAPATDRTPATDVASAARAAEPAPTTLEAEDVPTALEPEGEARPEPTADWSDWGVPSVPPRPDPEERPAPPVAEAHESLSQRILLPFLEDLGELSQGVALDRRPARRQAQLAELEQRLSQDGALHTWTANQFLGFRIVVGLAILVGTFFVAGLLVPRFLALLLCPLGGVAGFLLPDLYLRLHTHAPRPDDDPRGSPDLA